jgi:threonyl-tRNA synthetase
MNASTQTDEQKSDHLYRLRHSAAHIMAQAVTEMFPDAKLGIGPPIEDGFYYDFDLPRTLSPEDLEAIESRMRKIIKEDHTFTCRPLDEEQAREFFAAQPYKLELIEGLGGDGEGQNGEQITTYRQADFEDLCRGPHVEHTAEINPEALKLTHVAGAYWRGDERRPMLQRIYGTLWESGEELSEYLERLEEARRRDHRRIGVDMELFAFSEEVGKGLPLWLPNGTVIREELERWAVETERARGYQRIVTPHITRAELYRISGHIPYFEEDLYAPIEIEGDDYYLRPMNCPHHHMVYKAKPRSYRELPLRFAEYGTVYRHERSGTLHGMMRARGFTQNDAHIYCALDEVAQEFLAVLRLHEYFYTTLGIEDFSIKLALRDPAHTDKYHGDASMWETSERITREVIEQSGIAYSEDIGGAAHYGPKLDFIIRAVTGREFASSTCQLDLYMPEQFDLTYADRDGSQKHVAVLHRAPLGSHERLVAFLTEEYAGAFPPWLAPIQVAIVTITDEQLDYAHSLSRRLHELGYRAEVESSGDSMQKKVRNAESMKVPYILVVGAREVEAGTVSVRGRGRRNLGVESTEEFIGRLSETVDSKALDVA